MTGRARYLAGRDPRGPAGRELDACQAGVRARACTALGAALHDGTVAECAAAP